MIELESIVDQLVKIYYNEEWWQSKKLSQEEARRYHTTLLAKGRILYYENLGQLYGYVESWRINFHQLGELVCHRPFSAVVEDVSTGNICWLANVWINKKYRESDVIGALKLSFFRLNYYCEYFVGERHKPNRVQTFHVLKRQEFYDKYIGGK